MLFLSHLQLRLEEKSDGLSLRAYIVKELLEDSSMKTSYEREVNVSEEDMLAFIELYEKLKSQIKSEDNLE